MKRHIDRRTFLQAAGLAAGSFFLPSLARADAAPQRPRRVVFMMTELGWNPFQFRMKPAGAPDELLLRSAYHPLYQDQPDPHRWEIDLRRAARDRFSSTLDPLYTIRDRVLALDGLGMLSIGADGLGDAHARGWNHALSGFPAAEYITGQRAMGGRPSIDMQIARALRAREPQLTDLAALHFYIGAEGWGGGVDTFHHFFYDTGPNGEIVKVPTESNPRAMFDKLFPNGGVPSSDTNPIDRGQRDVLSLLGERYSSVFPRLSRRDQQKLDLHRELITDIKTRLEILDSIQCSVPTAPNEPHVTRELPGDQALDANIDAFYRLAATAMSCDLTRVVSMQFANQGRILSPVYGADNRDFHEWYSHGTNPPKRWLGVEGARVSEEEHNKFLDAAPIIANKNRYHVEQAARFAELLDSIPDGDGTLLDNTLIVLMDEISHGSHGHDQWPVVLIGGFGGAFRMGRYIRYPRINPSPSFNGSGAYAGVPHSHLLISILQHMGISGDSLGLDSVYGRVAGSSGQYINLRGPLAGLS